MAPEIPSYSARHSATSWSSAVRVEGGADVREVRGQLSLHRPGVPVAGEANPIVTGRAGRGWHRRVAAALALPSRVRSQAPLPQVLRLPEVLARPARQDEEQIAQPIDVLERPLADRLRARQGEDPALGAPAHRAGLMQEAADRGRRRAG